MTLQLIFYSILALLNALAGLYLLVRWKYVEKEHRSPMVLEWGIAFILWSGVFGFYLLSNLSQFSLDYLRGSLVATFILMGLVFAIFFRSLLRFFTEKNWILWLLPFLVYFIYLNLGIIVIFFMPGEFALKQAFFSNFVVSSFALVLAALFLLAYGRLITLLIYPRHVGALLIGISFLLFSLEMGLSSWMVDTLGLIFWYIARLTTQLLLVLGIVMLEKHFHVDHHHKKVAKHVISHLKLENSKPESPSTKS